MGAKPAESAGVELGLQRTRGHRIDLGRLVGVPVMAVLLIANTIPLFHVGDAGSRGLASSASGFVARLLTVSFYALVVAVYLRRSPARATSRSRLATAAAMLASYLPFSLGLLNTGTPSLPMLVTANALLILGLSFSLWSIRSLDRSFSIIPQARTVVRKGPYGVARHPLYTAELTATLGIALLHPVWAAFAIWVALCGLQAYRACHEEAILLATLPEYAEYKKQTPQLIPLSMSRAFRKRTVCDRLTKQK